MQRPDLGLDERRVAAEAAAGAARLAYDGKTLDPAAEALLAASGWDDLGLDRAITASDEMLSWAAVHRIGSRQQALVSYFTAGVMASRAVEAVLAWRFGPSPGPEPVAGGPPRPRVLDFASGWGRVTRFLVRRRPAADLTVSDVDAAAVADQRRRFGVAGFPSTESPEDLVCERSFDAVLALSLFSHLPEASFHAWLARLTGLVAPGGLLLFSVHGGSELPPGLGLPPSGLHFEPVSETGRLAKASYGSTWVSEGFVAAALARLRRPRLAWRRFPRALWHLQDLYLVLPDGEPEGAHLAACSLPDEPRGSLDGWRLGPEGEVELVGWAATVTGPARRVEVLVGGQRVAEAAPDHPREDVVALLGTPAARMSGWRLLLPREAAARSGEVLSVVAESADGTRGVLHAAILEATAANLGARQALAVVEAELRGEVAARERRLVEMGWEAEVLRRRIAAMEASRFWKLRNAWFAVKRRLGLVPR